MPSFTAPRPAVPLVTASEKGPGALRRDVTTGGLVDTRPPARVAQLNQMYSVKEEVKSQSPNSRLNALAEAPLLPSSTGLGSMPTNLTGASNLTAASLVHANNVAAVGAAPQV